MARPSIELVAALREAARRLREGANYAWGHHGACNCGHLLQVITAFSEADILRYAHTGTGEWTELAEEYCRTAHAPLSFLFAKLEEAGLTTLDIHHIEYLNCTEVLDQLPGGFRWLRRNERDDVIRYLETFASILEEKLIRSVDINVNDLLPASVEL
jgi:hypothetical protein